MALQEIITQKPRLRVLMALPTELRMPALRAANPQLAAEVDAVVLAPNRVRKLTVESACELVTWVEDPEVIAAIVAVDSRSAVTSVARRRLQELQASPQTDLVANGKNIEKRTRKALAKPFNEIIPTLIEMNEVDSALVSEWVTTLSDTELISVLPTLAADRTLRDAYSALVERFMTYIEGKDAETITAACSIVPSYIFFDRLLAKFSGVVWPFEAAVITITANQSRYVPENVRVRPAGLTPEAAAYWRSVGRADLLIWAGAATETEVAAAFAAMTQEGLFRTAKFITSAKEADILVAELDRRQLVGKRFGDRMWDVSVNRVLHIGIADDTLVKLLSTAGDPVIIDWFFGRMENNPPTHHLMERVTKEVLSFNDIAQIMRRLSSSGDTDNGLYQTMIRLFAEHVDGSAGSFFNVISSGYNGAPFVAAAIAAIGAEEFGTDEEAWAMFWVLFSKESQGTLMDVIQASKLLVQP